MTYIDIISVVIGMLMMTGCILWKLTTKESKDCLVASIIAFLIGLALVVSGIWFYCINSN